MDQFTITCNLAGHSCAISAMPKQLPEYKGMPAYQLSDENLKFIGYIVKHPDGRYRGTQGGNLNQDDISVIGKQIDFFLTQQSAS